MRLYDLAAKGLRSMPEPFFFVVKKGMKILSIASGFDTRPVVC